MFQFYDLVFYDLTTKDSIIPNKIFRNDLLKHKETKFYTELNIATKPYLEKQRFSDFEEFLVKHDEEWYRRRNYTASNIFDWYEKHKNEIGI